MTTPDTMSRLLARLKEAIDDADADAKESHAEAMNSYGAGYDRGYADGLIRLWRDITGDEVAE